MTNRSIRMTTTLFALAISMTGCGGGARLVHAPDDKTVGAGLVIVELDAASAPQGKLLLALSLANLQGKEGEAIESAKGAAQGYASILSGGVPDEAMRSSVTYDLALSLFLAGDLEAAGRQAEIARGLVPESAHITALQQRIDRQMAGLRHQWITASVSAVEGKVIAQTDISNTHTSRLDGLTIAIKEHQKNMEALISNQDSVLDRAIGKYIPVKIPDNLDTDIKALESVASSADTWPKTDAALERYAEVVNAVIRSIPPWAEKDLLPRVNVLRWNLEAFKALYASDKGEGIDLIQLSSAIDDAIDAIPPGADKAIGVALTEAKRATDVRAAASRKSNLIQRGKDALTGKGDASQAWIALEPLVSDEKSDEQQQIRELRRKLRAGVVNSQAMAQGEALHQDLGRLEKEPDWRLRQIGYSQVLQSASGQLLSLRVEQDVTDEVLKTIRATRTEAQAKVDAISTDRYKLYQKWALGKILSSEAEFFRAKQQVEDKGWGSRSWADEQYSIVRNAMVNGLIPINTGLLDTGVMDIYQRVHGVMAEKLKDNLFYLTQVAEQAAIVAKRGLNDD